MPTPALLGTNEYTYPCCKLQTAYLRVTAADTTVEAERQCNGCRKKYIMVMRTNEDGTKVVDFEKWRDVQPKPKAVKKATTKKAVVKKAVVKKAARKKASKKKT